MRKLFLFTTLALSCSIDVGLFADTPAKAEANCWTPNHVWNWFANQALPMGFNCVPANSISYTEMWMDYAFDPKMMSIRRSSTVNGPPHRKLDSILSGSCCHLWSGKLSRQHLGSGSNKF